MRVMSNQKQAFLFCLCLLCAAPTRADVKMPAVFGDHMVLQQDAKLPVWGWADPGEAVTVAFDGKSAKAIAGPDGRWRVTLNPVPVNASPSELTVTGKNALKFEDVLVGDVWLASGQSNMEIPVGVCHNKDTEMPKADDPELRYFVVNPIAMLDPETGLRPPMRPDRAGKWIVSTPQSIGGCSGVAYFFVRDLRHSLNKPIGLIQSTFYSSAAEAWTSPEVIQKNVSADPDFQKWLDARATQLAAFPPKIVEYNKEYADFPNVLKKWKDVDLPAFKVALMAWYKASDAAKRAGQPPLPPLPGPPRPEPPRYPDAGGIAIAGNLFNGMIAPVIPYAIKGTIWYQGEANAGRAEQYKRLLPLMIGDWRARWGEGDLPFFLVQLASFGSVSATPCPPRDSWQLLREAQFQLANSVPNSGIATAVDVGAPNNIHPRDKMDVGLRLGLVARNRVYGEKIVSYGPTYDSMKVEGNKIRVTFKNVGSGLLISAPPWTAPGFTPPATDELHGFAIAGADKQWVWAKARIDGDSVLAWSDQVPNPVAVRYAWANAPEGLNFYNKEMLPAFPFRTDDWNP